MADDRFFMKAVLIATIAVGILWQAAVSPAQAGDAVRQGIQVGTAIPHQLEVPDQTNQVQSFVTLKKNRGLILIFSRSLSW